MSTIFLSSVEYSCKLFTFYCILANSVDPYQTALIWVHTVCKNWLLKSQADDKADDNCCDWQYDIEDKSTFHGTSVKWVPYLP